MRIGFVMSVAGAVLLAVVSRPLLPSVGHALEQALAPSRLCVAVAGQLASLALCSVALRVLAPKSTLGAATLSRWVRDAVGALPVGLPGLSEAAGVRVLGLCGLAPTEALAVTTADVLAETLAQAAYALCAVALAPLSLASLPHAHPFSLSAAMIAGAAAVLGALALRLAPSAWRATARAVVTQTIARLRSARFAASVLLHGLAWVAGGLQILVLTHLLGAPLNLLQALSLEGLVFAARAAAFVVPAGVGVQELALAGLGSAYGLPAAAITTLALLLRLRDLVAYSPALVIWFAGELRQALRPAQGAALEPADGGLNSCSP